MGLVHIAACFLFAVSFVDGHGRLLEPPSRASAWRLGFSTPPNYDDNQLFCGGASNQWQIYDGKCGVCGDPYQGPREHEAGGKYATGTIVRTYTRGQDIEITIELTANHLGYFEMRICPNNDVSKAVTQECLDENLLALSDGSGTRFMVTDAMRMVTFNVRLPDDIVCSQCVIQWKYNAGNSWGTDFDTGVGCKGCGPQEQFYGCADVTILDGDSSGPVSTVGPGTTNPAQRTTSRPGSSTPPPDGKCRAIGIHESRPGFHKWCNDNCSRGYCPGDICACN